MITTTSLNQTKLQKDFDKKEYNAGASSVKIICWYFISTIFFRSGIIPFSSVLVILLKAFGCRAGKDIRVKPFVNIKYPWKLTIGDHSWIGENCVIENLAQVTLGKNVCLSQGSKLITGNHNYKRTSFDLFVKPIFVEDGAWIGANAIVCPGALVATHAILTVGSVATKNMESYAIYQGNPAVQVRERELTDS
jgi:putative colanic acid biosynthesis acetyltransferase WcaF